MPQLLDNDEEDEGDDSDFSHISLGTCCSVQFSASLLIHFSCHLIQWGWVLTIQIQHRMSVIFCLRSCQHSRERFWLLKFRAFVLLELCMVFWQVLNYKHFQLPVYPKRLTVHLYHRQFPLQQPGFKGLSASGHESPLAGFETTSFLFTNLDL